MPAVANDADDIERFVVTTTIGGYGVPAFAGTTPVDKSGCHVRVTERA